MPSLSAVLLVALACSSLGCSPTVRSPEPEPGLRALVISDLNSRYGSTTYAPEVARAVALARDSLRPDLVLIAGDMVAGQSAQLADSTVRAMWAAFDRTVAAPLRSAGIPLVVTVGNHDASAYAAHARDRRIAAEYWRSTGRAAVAPMLDDAHFPFRYTVRMGDVFIAVWDGTNQESSRSDTLVAWLRDALQSDAARAASHRVVLSHLPLYGVAVGRSQPGEVLADGDSLRRALERWGATLVISGHHHAFYPGRRGELVLLHSGALGDGPRRLVGSPADPYKALATLVFLRDSVSITAMRVDSSGALSLVAPSSLPPVLCGYGGWVMRRDVLAADTSCSP